MATRAEKFPETNTFHFYNANPKNRFTEDCTFRAMCTALDQDYYKTVMEMAEAMCKSGYALNGKKGEEYYLMKVKGWRKMPQPKKENGKKYTGEEFCNYLTKNYPGNKLGNIYAFIGGHHVVCIKWCDDKYKIHDIWDSTDGCIGNYYIK